MSWTCLNFPSSTLCVIVMAFSLTGCTNSSCCQKERSFCTANTILSQYSTDEVFKVIHGLEDIESLRIIAISSYFSAWPMEAGPDADFDNRMDDISHAAIQKMYLIDSPASREAIEQCKRIFKIDGAYSRFFKELEDARRTRH